MTDTDRDSLPPPKWRRFDEGFGEGDPPPKWRVTGPADLAAARTLLEEVMPGIDEDQLDHDVYNRDVDLVRMVQRLAEVVAHMLPEGKD